MKRCPQCEYLVPSSWDECEQCGAELRSAPAVLPLGTTPSERIVKPYQFSDTRRHGGVGVATASRSRAPTIAIGSPKARSARSGTGSQTSRRARQRGAEALDVEPQAQRRRGQVSVPIIGPLAIVLIGISVWVAYQRVAHPPMPAEIRAWVEQGRGITYAPAGESFSISLPTTAVESSSRIALSPGVEGYARIAVSTIGRREFGIAWVRVAPASLSNRGQPLAQTVTEIAERAAGLRIFVANQTTSDGRLTVAAEIERSGHDGRAYAQLVDDIIYVVFADGPSPSGAGFDHLVASLEISSSRR